MNYQKRTELCIVSILVIVALILHFTGKRLLSNSLYYKSFTDVIGNHDDIICRITRVYKAKQYAL